MNPAVGFFSGLNYIVGLLMFYIFICIGAQCIIFTFIRLADIFIQRYLQSYAFILLGVILGIKPVTCVLF